MIFNNFNELIFYFKILINLFYLNKGREIKLIYKLMGLNILQNFNKYILNVLFIKLKLLI